MPEAIDVVVVPDFAGPGRACFEARALFFLASWMEYGGAACNFPLHLACIGDPPPSVARLAAQCGARIRVFPPMVVDRRRTSNKLRGLEVDAKTDRILLLDVDILVLSDFSDIVRLGPVLAASAAVGPSIQERHWRRIYDGLNLSVPEERVVSMRGRLNNAPLSRERYPGQNDDLRSMFPYYNSGVLLVPRASGLRGVWEDHATRTATMFDPGDEAYRSATSNDQVGLATAIGVLRSTGLPFVDLPDRFHATRLQVYRRTPRLDDIALFHAFWLFMSTRRIDWTLPIQLERFHAGLVKQLLDEWRRDATSPSRWHLLKTYLGPALSDAWDLRRRLQRLYHVHVRPALRATASA